MEVKQRHITFRAVIFGSLFCFLAACSFNAKEEWAAVEDVVLTKEDGEGMMRALQLDPKNKKDRDAFLLDWIAQQEYALYLKETQPNLYYEIKANGIKEGADLYKFHIESSIIKKMLDDQTPMEKEILAYYKKHRKNFSEEIYLVKALYLKVALNKLRNTNIDQLYLLKNGKDREEVKNFANLYATNFYFEENKWIVFDDLVREMPMDVNIKELIESKGKIVSKDNQFAYYLNILSYNTKEALKPNVQERELIEKRILSQKAKNIRVELNDSITQLIENRYEINIYTK
ncbi:hypothetical protein SAMN05216474_2087 [Lishizhenia tianjinensis]|uniref:PPIC-type PPIASE domain-containing protein n=1 Tax=Lishizhenia tianjinensis TaxID=477690 RepID=A0A1I7AH47_9FLAO|nr:hypothetical protein [Lishizhenia tianjinensis]SFT74272.1 hypothetical protein SAMN05216474_2087 [Lishizhenia tianjinensis]